MKIVKLLAVLVVPMLPLAAHAAGAHDTVGCTGCHSIHNAKGDFIFEVPANKKVTDPKTGQPVTGVTALCLGCHQPKDKGGQDIAPVFAHSSHPFATSDVNPKVANVPGEGMRNGKFAGCVGCHDPHPSNPNYRYLRVDTQNGKNIEKFCAACHSSKADASSVQNVAFFTSMDERAGAQRPAAAKPAAPAPKK